MGRTSDIERFILFAGAFHLLISLTLAYVAGVVSRKSWQHWIASSSSRNF